MDKLGPTKDRKYLLAVVDRITRYHKVEVVDLNLGKDKIGALDCIF